VDGRCMDHRRASRPLLTPPQTDVGGRWGTRRRGVPAQHQRRFQWPSRCGSACDPRTNCQAVTRARGDGAATGQQARPPPHPASRRSGSGIPCQRHQDVGSCGKKTPSTSSRRHRQLCRPLKMSPITSNGDSRPTTQGWTGRTAPLDRSVCPPTRSAHSPRSRRASRKFATNSGPGPTRPPPPRALSLHGPPVRLWE